MDTALRAANVHPNLVPEAVKLTAVRVLRRAEGGAAPTDAAFTGAAALLGYCLTGRDMFTELNDEALVDAVEARIRAATDSGDGVDAELLLLALHAGIVRDGVIERFGLEAVDE